jgi:hypothetical protein
MTFTWNHSGRSTSTLQRGGGRSHKQEDGLWGTWRSCANATLVPIGRFCYPIHSRWPGDVIVTNTTTRDQRRPLPDFVYNININQ